MFYKICSLLAVFVCFYTARLHSQQTSFTISGYITDAKTGESLIGATVFDLKSGKGTIANNYGFYSLTLPADSVRLRFSYVGYQTMLVPLLLKASQQLDIKITGITELQGVEIIAETSEQNFEKSQMSTMDLSMDKVRALPVLLGERDILKTIQLLPGVQSGTEGSAGLYVRGGGPDQNLILLDGVPVYNANHLFGFFSVFNTDAINSVKLIKGGFPAEYGGRLSSVIDIHMKEGNNQKFHGEGGIGLIASRLTLEGPIVKDKTSFIVSGRRTYVDVLARPFIRSQGDVDGGYFFYDLNTKINHKFSDRSRLFLSGYFGRDKFFAKDRYSTGEGNNWNSFEEEFESGLDWGNAIGAVRWNYIFNPRLFSNTTLTYSQYKFKVFNEVETKRVVEGVPSEEYARVYYDSGIRDWSVKSDFSFVPNPDHYIKFGGAYMYHTFNPGVNQFTDKITGAERDTTYGSEEILAHEFYTYIDDDFVLSEKLKINAGLHFSGFFVNDVSYFSLQPRFSGRYLIDRRTSIKASYAHMAQYLHLLTNAGIGLPTDLWVPPTENIKPQLAHQVAAGVSRGISEMYEFTFEAYYKTMQNLIEYQDGASFLGNASDWQNKVETGKGWAYGGEFMLEKKKGKTTGWIGYTLSWSNRQFENLNFGRTFPYKYDRRHDISVVVTHKFSDRVDVGLVWVYGTGNAVTLPFERYSSMPGFSDGFGNGEIGHIESRNNYRMAAYHRLDLGVNLHRKTKWGESTWNFGLYNAYSRQNPFFLYFTYDSRGNQRLTQFSLFPVIPSVTYNFKF